MTPPLKQLDISLIFEPWYLVPRLGTSNQKPEPQTRNQWPPRGTSLFWWWWIGAAHLSRLQVSLRLFSSCCRKLTSDLRVHCSDWLSESSRSICQHTASLSGCGSGSTFDPGRLTSCSWWLRCLLSATRAALRSTVCCSSFFNTPSEKEKRSTSCLACRGRQTQRGQRVLALDHHQGEVQVVLSIYSRSTGQQEEEKEHVKNSTSFRASLAFIASSSDRCLSICSFSRASCRRKDTTPVVLPP